MIIWGNEETRPLFARWAAEKMAYIDPEVGLGPCQTAAVCTGMTENDRILAVIVYHQFDRMGGTVQMSISAASPRWATKDNIRTLLSAPFDQWKCRKVWSVIASTWAVNFVLALPGDAGATSVSWRSERFSSI